MHFNKIQKFLFGYFVVLTVYWVWLQSTGYRDTNWNYFYSFAFSLMPLLGGVLGMVRANIWGRTRSALGRAVTVFSAGLFAWGLGSMVWAYYNFIVGEAAPYPSVADVGYIVAAVMWVLGAFYLSKASGARFGLRRTLPKVFALGLAVIIVGMSYYLLIEVARDGVLLSEGTGALKAFLDVAYPVGDIVILASSLIIFGLSFKFLGGYYKNSIIVWLVGIAAMYFADFIFSYTTTTGSFYVGNWGDLVFALATGLMTFGVLGFTTRPLAAKTASAKTPEA
jgi:hypothetical protein